MGSLSEEGSSPGASGGVGATQPVEHRAGVSWKNAASKTAAGPGGGEQSTSPGETDSRWAGRRSPQGPSLSALGRDSEKLNIIAEKGLFCSRESQVEHTCPAAPDSGRCTQELPSASTWRPAGCASESPSTLQTGWWSHFTEKEAEALGGARKCRAGLSLSSPAGKAPCSALLPGGRCSAHFTPQPCNAGWKQGASGARTGSPGMAVLRLQGQPFSPPQRRDCHSEAQAGCLGIGGGGGGGAGVELTFPAAPISVPDPTILCCH